jgi:branched-chain amino acid transport system permease protein
MQTVLLFAVLGLGQGALIAGIAVAVVVTYRGSGIINLATGAAAMVSGYVFWALTSGHFGIVVSAGPAAGLASTAAMAIGALTELIAFIPLRQAPPLAKLAASLGLLLALQAGVLLVFGTQPRQAPSVLPEATVRVAGVDAPLDRFILAAVVVAITLVLDAAYRCSRFGLATRAAAENEHAALLAGLSTNHISMANTLLGSAIAGLFGILAAPITQVDSFTLPLQVVPALAAALFARFTSLWVACAAGLLLGMSQSVLYYLSTQSWFPTDQGNPMPGTQSLLVFVAIVVALFLRGSRLPERGQWIRFRLPAVPAPTRLKRPALLSVVVGAGALVVLPFDFRQALVNAIIGAIIVLSYVVITGYVGQISVMQLALSGTAGFLLSHPALRSHLPFPIDAFGAVAISTLLGVACGAAALRVRGVSLAVVTLAAAMAMEQALFLNTGFGGRGGVAVASPHLLGVDLGPDAGFRGLDGSQPSPVFGWLVLAVAAVLGLYVANLRRTGLGRQMLAIRSNERAAAAAGVNVRGVKTAAFAISSFIAAVAGVLYGYNFSSVSANRFTAMAALSLVAFAYVGGITRVSGAVIAGMLSTEALVPHALEEWFGLTGTWLLLIGAALLLFTLVVNPDGIAGTARWRRTGSSTPRSSGPAATMPAGADARSARGLVHARPEVVE